MTMGAEVMLCGPRTLMPRHIDQMGVRVSHNLEEAIEWADVLNVLRIQLERQEAGLFPSIREYHAEFGVTLDKLKKVDKEITIMHPGPINRGIELDSDVADSDFSVILNQVTNGVAVRMAVLYLLSDLEGTEDK